MKASLAILLLLLASVAQAHPGGLNECGCHAGSESCHCHQSNACGCDCEPASCDLVGCACDARPPAFQQAGMGAGEWLLAIFVFGPFVLWKLFGPLLSSAMRAARVIDRISRRRQRQRWR